jgi:hypothetical protein
MPDALDLLKTRRSVKPMELTGPAPSDLEIDTLLGIAARVPDHGKLTPWRFIVFAGAPASPPARASPPPSAPTAPMPRPSRSTSRASGWRARRW